MVRLLHYFGYKISSLMLLKSLQSCLTLCNPTDCSQPGSSIHGNSPGKNTGVGCHACSEIGGSSQLRDRWVGQVDYLLSEPSGNPENSGVGSLSLFQGIFPTQESNRCLLDCWLILYQLSCQGSLTFP